MVFPKNILLFDSEKKWIESASEALFSAFQEKKEKYTFALSGGSTPAAIYTDFAKKIEAECSAEQKQRTHIFLADERYISEKRPESNAYLVNKSFFQYLSCPLPEKHFFDTENQKWEKSAEKYEEEITPFLPLHTIVLGIGPDGHIASLFPFSPALSTHNEVTTSETDVFDIKKRLSLSLFPILSAKKILVFLKGSSKEAVLSEFFFGEKTPEEFPAKNIKNHPNCTFYFLQ
jgi:6-phosphogluconolactonase